MRPADPDAVLDTIPDELYERDKFLPYWAELWPSAEILSSFVETIVPNGPCLACEIGAGLAVPSAVAAAVGMDIVTVDISPAACLFAEYNILTQKSAKTRSLVVCADWRACPFAGQFDFILGADVLYESRWIVPVAEFLQHHLKPAGRAYIADPGRASWQAFQNELSMRDMPNQIVLQKQSSNNKSVIEILAISN